ncbi:MAG: hypothetical protein KGO05_11970 [Chloroflexota bacterium]|nr:hypothetical protein [Chloroflexota bacterium]
MRAAIVPEHMRSGDHGTNGARHWSRPIAFSVARIICVIICALVAILDLVSIPLAYQYLLTPCSPCAPNSIQMTMAQAQQFQAVGWGPQTFAISVLTFTIITQSVYIGLGLLLLLRRADDGMALFTALTLTAFGGAAFTGTMHALDSVSAPLALITYSLNVIGQSAFITFLYIFPTGRFVPRWTIIPDIVWTLSWLDPFLNIPALHQLAELLDDGPFFILMLLTLIIAQVYRYGWVSTPSQRQQTKWVVFGLGAGLGGFASTLVVGNMALAPSFTNQALPTLLSNATIDVFFILIPIAIVIAILRSRLYDIDIVINRALVYGSLTAILAALYFGLVIGAQILTRQITGRQESQSQVVIVLSTLVIAAIFQPLRRRLQRAIDRRFYRSRYDATRTIDAFNATLRQEVDLNDLREQLIGVVDETMRPTSVALWLNPVRAPTTDTPEIR